MVWIPSSLRRGNLGKRPFNFSSYIISLRYLYFTAHSSQGVCCLLLTEVNGLSLLHRPRYHLCGAILEWIHTGFHESWSILDWRHLNAYRVGVYWDTCLGGCLSLWVNRFPARIPNIKQFSPPTRIHFFLNLSPHKKYMFFSWTSFWCYFLQMNALTLLCREHSQLPWSSYLQWGTSNHNYFSNSERKRKIGQWYGKKNLSAQTFQQTHQQPRQEYYTRLYSRFFQYVNHRIPFFFLLLFQYNSIKNTVPSDNPQQ